MSFLRWCRQVLWLCFRASLDHMGLLAIVGRRLVKQISLQSSPVPVPDPIPTLPWELQSLILEHYSSEPETTSVKEQLLPLWVCSAWRDYLLTQSPEYWTFIHVTLHEDVVHLSKQIVDLLSFTDPSRLRLAKIVIDLAEIALQRRHRHLFPAAHRLIPLATDSVEIISTYARDDHIRHESQISDIPVPVTTVLDVMGLNTAARSFSFKKQGRDWTDSRPPVFTLSNADSDLTSFRWTNLRELSIHDTMSVTFCHAMLTSCGSRLEKLSLKGITRFWDGQSHHDISIDPQLQSTSLPKIALPNLTDLTLEFHLQIGEALAFILDCPNVTNLGLGATYPALMLRITSFPFNWSKVRKLSCRSPEESIRPRRIAGLLRRTPHLESVEWAMRCLNRNPILAPWEKEVGLSCDAEPLQLAYLRSVSVISSDGDVGPLLDTLLSARGTLDELTLSGVDFRLPTNVTIRSLHLVTPLTVAQCLSFFKRNGFPKKASIHLHGSEHGSAATGTTRRSQQGVPLDMPNVEELSVTYHGTSRNLSQYFVLPQGLDLKQSTCLRCSRLPHDRCVAVISVS